MPTEAPPAPPAKQPTSAPESRIQIPNMNDLIKKSGSTVREARAQLPPVPIVQPPPAPREAPEIKPEIIEFPEGSDPQDVSDIPTDVRGKLPEKPASNKSPREFKEQRRENKPGLKRTVEELETTLAQTMAELEQTRQRATEFEGKHKTTEEERETFRKLAHDRDEEVKQLDEKYFKTFNPNVDPGSDEDFVKAHHSFVNGLSSKLPAYIPGEDGQPKRLNPASLFNDGTKLSNWQIAVGHYNTGLHQGNDDVMNWAVNWGAKLLGIPGVEMAGGLNDPRNKGLTPDDQMFQNIEAAFKEAAPHLVKKAERLQFIQENGPKIIEERFGARRSSIIKDLTGKLLMEPEQYSAALAKDNTDSRALISAIVDKAPILRELLKGEISNGADVLAAIPDNVLLPPPKSNSKGALDEHRKLLQTTRAKASEMAYDAVIGKIAGKIIASLVGERDELQKRVDGVSRNTNPGGGKTGGSGEGPNGDGRHNPQDTSEIPTDVTGYKPGED